MVFFFVVKVFLLLLVTLELLRIVFGAFFIILVFIIFAEITIEGFNFFILLLGKLLKKYCLATALEAFFGLVLLVLDVILIL